AGTRCSRDIPPRMCPTGDEAPADRIGFAEKNDGNRAGRRFGCGRWPGPTSHDDVHRETSQLGREVGEAIELAIGGAVLESEVLALNIPEFTEPLPECLVDPPNKGQVPDAPHLPRWLRIGSTWHHEDAESEDDGAHHCTKSHGGLLPSALTCPHSAH